MYRVNGNSLDFSASAFTKPSSVKYLDKISLSRGNNVQAVHDADVVILGADPADIGTHHPGSASCVIGGGCAAVYCGFELLSCPAGCND
jgi:hypothetical protein